MLTASTPAIGAEPAPPTQAPSGDTITPLVQPATRQPDISPTRGYFWFYVGAPMNVTHTLHHNGKRLGRQTVDCPSAHTWRARITFSPASQRALRRLLRNERRDKLTWTMAATDRQSNTTTQTVTLYR